MNQGQQQTPPPAQPPYAQQQQQQQQQPQYSGQPAQQNAQGSGLQDVMNELTSINTKLQALQQSAGRPDAADLRQQIEQVRQQQSMIVEAMSNLLKNVVTKTDLDNVQRKVDSLSSSAAKDQGDVRGLLNDLKATVSSKVGARSDDILRNIEDINQNLKALKVTEEQTQRSTRQIAENLHQNAQDLTQTIQQSTTFGFWSYFLFVQAIFIFGYVWWRKHREDANKKLI
eukprot:Phypoly_transcript_18212.p1 GENE.Phypoly_transcript_18212~~Phypoly_transcript_18212.p1  ORF type:complete len:256 (+),score=55.13 Phypoly_transcript_18212:85-768(+)